MYFYFIIRFHASSSDQTLIKFLRMRDCFVKSLVVDLSMFFAVKIEFQKNLKIPACKALSDDYKFVFIMPVSDLHQK